ncbi:MAG: hypothetical protein LWX11_02980, partial [Firmicutes bacterium]|nr:hypothetical protein [Bacillota bacterium]
LLRLQGLAGFSEGKGAKVDLVGFHDNLRFGGASRVVDVQGATATLEIPETLALRERRTAPRARLNPREGATLTGLTSLFEGVGITGLLENLSEAGCRVRVERAMNIKDQKKMGLGTALVSPGHVFQLLKLNNVPRCPSVMELAGRVAYVESGSGGLVLGLAFEGSGFAAALKTFVSSRASAVPTALPPKTRRKEMPKEIEAPPADPAPPDSPKAAPQEKTEWQEKPSPSEEAAPPFRNLPLVRLKKRSRALMILATEEEGESLERHFLEEGYGRVERATQWSEVVTGLQASPVQLLLVDLESAPEESLDMLERLHPVLDMPPVLLAASSITSELVLTVRRVPQVHLLVKPYALDEALSQQVEQQLEL